MRDRDDSNALGVVPLQAVAAAPLAFEAAIVEGDAGLGFELVGLDPSTGSTLRRRYVLAGREQGDYLDLFEKLAHAYGARLPRNARVGEPASITVPYRVLLDTNISPKIWYGYGDPAVLKVPAGRVGGNEDW